MAVTAEAAKLTEAHRLAQARLGALVVSQLFAAFRVLDPADLDRSFPDWLKIVVPIVAASRTGSARLAANYWATFRALELGVAADTARPVLAENIDRKAVVTSFVVTGPAAIKAAMTRGAQLEAAARTAQATSARAGMRHALNGGRDTIVESLRADRQALGWARATSGKPCHFCAMLASRGPVYGEGADFAAHDGCSCTAEPVYHRDSDWPAGSRRYQELWQETTRELSGDEAANAFRQALEA